MLALHAPIVLNHVAFEAPLPLALLSPHGGDLSRCRWPGPIYLRRRGGDGGGVGTRGGTRAETTVAHVRAGRRLGGFKARPQDCPLAAAAGTEGSESGLWIKVDSFSTSVNQRYFSGRNSITTQPIPYCSHSA